MSDRGGSEIQRQISPGIQLISFFSPYIAKNISLSSDPKPLYNEVEILAFLNPLEALPFRFLVLAFPTSET